VCESERWKKREENGRWSMTAHRTDNQYWGKSQRAILPKRAIGPADATDFTFDMDNRRAGVMAHHQSPSLYSATIFAVFLPTFNLMP
jgi:hypothetical protein